MATIKDVAREAGVSIATVSRVFNDSAQVSPGTEQTVREVASRLNYWPNGAARSLITNRTHTVGVLLPDMYGEFFSGVIRGLDVTARREGFHLLVSSSHSNAEELVAVLRSMRGRVDGLVVMAPDVDMPPRFRGWAGDVPIVLIDPPGRVDGYDSVSIANFQGAHTMVRHLASLGHRRIATVTGPEANVDARQRLRGYRAALRAARLDHSDAYEIPGDFTESSGHAAVAALLRLDPRPSAVFVGNDHMAVGVLRGLAESGLSVPRDMAVAGFDDIESARYLTPPLTTVSVDRMELGARALQHLIHSARDSHRPPGHVHEVLPTQLVVRASCGASARVAADSNRAMESSSTDDHASNGAGERRSS